MEERASPRYIDIFAGCGGLSLGLYNAGWKGLFAIEKSKHAFETLKYNLVDKKKHFDWPDWLEIKEHDINEILTNHEDELKKLVGTVDLVAGGPPCQGFSFAGKRNKDDERNDLVNSYVKFIDLIKPKILFFENVKGFTCGFKDENGDSGEPYSNKVVSELQKLGYNIEHKIINFSYFSFFVANIYSKKEFSKMNIATGRLALIEDRIGSEFENKYLLNLAFTHRSANPKTNNEILEFDGDKVLNFVIGTFLSKNHQLDEGTLTKLTSYFVNNKHVLPDICLELGLDEFVYIKKCEKNNILSRRNWVPDLLEALVGAIYRDTEDGIEVTKKLIIRLYGERLELNNEKIKKILRRYDPISALKEYCDNRCFFEVKAEQVGGLPNAPEHRGYVEMGAQEYYGDVILSAKTLAKENVCEKILADLQLI